MGENKKIVVSSILLTKIFWCDCLFLEVKDNNILFDHPRKRTLQYVSWVPRGDCYKINIDTFLRLCFHWALRYGFEVLRFSGYFKINPKRVYSYADGCQPLKPSKLYSFCDDINSVSEAELNCYEDIAKEKE